MNREIIRNIVIGYSIRSDRRMSEKEVRVEIANDLKRDAFHGIDVQVTDISTEDDGESLVYAVEYPNNFQTIMTIDLNDEFGVDIKLQ